jgi:alpha,alpha-trehalase
VENQERDTLIDRLVHEPFVLMLDFDGVLSDIVPRWEDAVISPDALDALRSITLRVPIAIISGRAIDDIRHRAPVPGAVFVGCHGLQTWRDGVMHQVVIDDTQQDAFRAARGALAAVAKRYIGVAQQDKGLAFALNYRALSDEASAAFRRDAVAAMEPYTRTGRVRIIDAQRTFDSMPAAGRDKGTSARELLLALRPDATPVYIGDSLTDEDAFRALPDGITIHVGPGETSARYRFETRAEVDVFLSALAASLDAQTGNDTMPA